MFASTLRKALVSLSSVALASLALVAQAAITIDEVFSNFDGTVQFVILNRSGDPSLSLAGRTLVATDGATTHRYTFASDVTTDPYHPVLLATERFASLGKIAPDYILPDGFLPLANASVALDVAQFDYASTRLPTDGWHALYRDPASGSAKAFVAAATNSRGDLVTLTRAPTPTGLWWNAAQPGWALAIEAQTDSTLVVWATHAADGSPTWFVAVGSPVLSQCDPGDIIDCDEIPIPGDFSGTLYAPSGPPGSAAAYDAARVSVTQAGSFTLQFPTPDYCDASGQLGLPCTAEGSFNFVVGATSGQRPFTRAVFGDPIRQCFLAPAIVPGPVNHEGLWWNPGEPGWAVQLDHQGDAIFAIFLTYDDAGRATWLSFTALPTASGAYEGTLYRTIGTPFSATPDPSATASTAVGTASLAFTDASHGTFTYATNGMSRTKAIEREQLARTPPICD